MKWKAPRYAHIAPIMKIDETGSIRKISKRKDPEANVEFYDKDHLIQLSKITKLPIEILSSKIINMDAVEKLVSKVDWFFDVFLMHKDYQKIRDGKKTADQIYHSIQKVIIASGLKIDLLKEYHLKTNKYPKSITLKHD